MHVRILMLIIGISYYHCALAKARPNVNAGPDRVVRKKFSLQLNGRASGVPNYKWKTTGTGVFSNRYSLRSKYTPGSSDIRAGKVYLILYSSANSAIRDTMLLSIAACPAVAIKADRDTICGYDAGGMYPVYANVANPPFHIAWTSSGTGTFFYEDTSFNYYQYSAGDAGLGHVWLIVKVVDPLGSCRPVADSIYVKLNDPARMDLPGEGYLSCGNDSVLINGGISGLATTVYWSTTGTGRFSRSVGPTTVYYPSPADRFNGNIQVSGITNDPPGPCPPGSDVANIEFGPYAKTFPVDTVLCAPASGGVLPVHAIASNKNVYWSSDGFGSFDDEYSIQNNYNYTASDVGRGNLELYFHVSSFNGCADFTDTIRVRLNEAPLLVFPQPKITVCASNAVVNAEVYVYGYANGGRWTTSGSGVFKNPGQAQTDYIASKADILKGCVNLYYTTGDPKGPCNSINGYMAACFSDCLQKGMAKNDWPVPANTVALSPPRVYPNPAKNTLYLSTGKALTSQQIYVTDVLGKTVLSTRSTTGRDNKIDVSRLKTGVYFLHTKSGKKNSVTKFMKKQ